MNGRRREELNLGHVLTVEREVSLSRDSSSSLYQKFKSSNLFVDYTLMKRKS